MESRIGVAERGVSIVSSIGLTIAIILALALVATSALIYVNARDIADTDTARIADSIQRANETKRDHAIECLLVANLKNVYGAYSRDTWPGGPDDYDAALKQVADTESSLKCEP